MNIPGRDVSVRFPRVILFDMTLGTSFHKFGDMFTISGGNWYVSP